MLKVLSNIVHKVKQVFKNEYSSESEDFRRGWRTCFLLFDVAFERDTKQFELLAARAGTQYNARAQARRVEELEEDIDMYKAQITKLSENLHKAKQKQDATTEEIFNAGASGRWPDSQTWRKAKAAATQYNPQ